MTNKTVGVTVWAFQVIGPCDWQWIYVNMATTESPDFSPENDIYKYFQSANCFETIAPI